MITMWRIVTALTATVPVGLLGGPAAGVLAALAAIGLLAGLRWAWAGNLGAISTVAAAVAAAVWLPAAAGAATIAVAAAGLTAHLTAGRLPRANVTAAILAIPPVAAIALITASPGWLIPLSAAAAIAALGIGYQVFTRPPADGGDAGPPGNRR